MADEIFKLDWERDQLWKGCMLASIAHAIMVAHYPDVSNEHSWDGINYSVQDGAGTRGTVTFGNNYCVAAFRNDKSDRLNLWNFRYAVDYFKEAPQDALDLAESEALQYLLDNILGQTIPAITTAFWGKDNELFTLDTLDDLFKYGGVLLAPHVMDFEAAVAVWTEYYDMSMTQIELLKSIYDRKIANPDVTITLTDEEVAMIGTNDPEGLNESVESFKEIGISMVI